MSFDPRVVAILANLEIAEENREEAGRFLSEFARLSEAGKNEKLPSAISKIFPLTFGDEAVIQGTDRYKDLVQKPWSTNCWLSPKVIVTPSSAQQVSKILALCRFLGVVFSIRGGGHLQNPGFCSNNGGVVISLSKFKNIAISEDKSTANIGVGLRWLEVYKELDSHGVSVTGGRQPTVGISGLLLGGGLSFQNGEHGFSCAGVTNFEVVLADSSIINANAKENSDLFWALKGGGPNFGVVTGIQMATLPNKVWAEARLYRPLENETLLEAMMTYHKAIEKDNMSFLYFLAAKEATLVVFFYCRPIENPEVFNCFYDIPYTAKLIEPGCKTVFEVLQGIANVLDVEQKSHEMRTMCHLPDLEAYKAAEASWKKKVEQLKNVDGLVLTLSLQPLSSGAMKATEAKGGSPLGIAVENQSWVLVMADWKDPADEDAIRLACREIIDAVESVAKKNGTYLPFVYSNYASRDQNPLASYGAKNLTKLKQIALRYDPEEIFQRLQNGGFLLSKS